MDVVEKRLDTATPSVVADLAPQSLDNAKRQFAEVYGSALVMNTYLKIALLLVSVLAVGLLVLNFRTQARFTNVKPLVIRIDEIGRAEALAYDAATYRPQAPELRYFLTRFVVTHFSRVRATLQRDFPNSLYFLAPELAETTMAHVRQSQLLETFVTNPAADEIEIEVRNVTLEGLSSPPYKASVHFEQHLYAAGTRQRRKQEASIAQIEFVLRDTVPSAFVPVNPLGLQITYFRVDEAFQ